MECDSCGLDTYIQQKELFFVGDDSKDTKTQAFYRLHFMCQNPACVKCGQEIGTEDIEIT